MKWFEKQFLNDLRLGLLHEYPIAYYSAEFALSQDLPIYSGGLGVLAGDVVREAADLGLPFVGVGLFYHKGYFVQNITSDGQKEKYTEINPKKSGLQLVTHEKKALLVEIPMKEGIVFAQIWKFKIKAVSIYLLDTNISQNKPDDRLITQTLYGGDIDMRIRQEIVLGIGGERALFAMDIHPWIYHMNEGHSAFAILEITHHVMGELQVDFKTAFGLVQNKMVFTNHTLVPAGNDIFPYSLVKYYLKTYASHLGLSITDVLATGNLPGTKDHFGMTMFAIRQSYRINAVSKLHEKEAKKLWPEFTMMGITNGVHLPTWTSKEMQVVTQFSPDQETYNFDKIPDDVLWKTHQKLRKDLIRFVNAKTTASFNSEILTLVWARRFATYKRPELLFSEIDTLKRIAKSAHGALQIIIAGKAHPKDTEGKKIITHITETIRKEKLSDWVVFFPNYDMKAASYLVSGSDIWLNTPIRGKEASGTSGMKAGANGVLQASICDGWYDEVCGIGLGWALDEKNTAKSVYTLLEQEILPLFYNRKADGIPHEWIGRMKRTMAYVMQNYSATRMLKEYVDTLYVPALNQFKGNYHRTKRIRRT